MSVYAHHVPVVFLSNAAFCCKRGFSLAVRVPTLSGYVFRGGKWHFCFPPFTFLTVCSGSSRSVSPCLWLMLVFKLNSIDLHNVSLTVVKSYSEILIYGVILGPRPTPTGVGGKNSTHLNETWTWEGISKLCTGVFLSNTLGL